MAHTHLAIKEHQIAREYLAIHDRQIAIAHLAMKEHQTANDLFSKRKCQVTRENLAMIVTFTHLAMRKGQIARYFLVKENDK